MMERMLRVLISMCAVCAMCSASLGDHIERRGSEAPLDGTIRVMDDNGVSIVSPTGAEIFVTWDHVRSVATGDPSLKSRLNEYQDTAVALWRARSRLERGDFALAEPLFERLFAQYRGKSHETALIVAEGLLRCRLQRSANDTAVIPGLEAIRLRRKGIKTTAYQTLTPLFDEATSLCVKLPPAWAPSSALPRVELELQSFDAQGDSTVAALAFMYRAAIRQSLALDPDSSRGPASDQAGVTLLQSLVACQDNDADRRAAACTALEKRLPDLPEWAQAWSRYAIGRSLLAESGIGRHEEALVSLAYLPASFQRDQPYLTALALAMMVLELQQLGETDSAIALRGDLIRDFPSHPALTLLERTSASRAAAWTNDWTDRLTTLAPPTKDPA